jgi:hypothetical protein
MHWTRLESNVAVELTNIDPVGRFHPSLVWVACPDDLTPGSVMNEDGSWTYAPPPPVVTEVPATGPVQEA